MTFKIPPPRQPASNLQRTPRQSSPETSSRAGRGRHSKLSPVADGPQEQSAHLPGGERAARARPSARASPSPGSGASPDPAAFPPRPGPPPQVQPSPLRGRPQVPTALAPFRGPPLPKRSFIHLPAPGVGGGGGWGKPAGDPPPQPRVGGAQGRHPGAGAYSGCPLRRSWLLGSLLG